MSTIFKRIIDGEIHCHKVFEDDYVLAFLDAYPLAKGHTLVVPKEEVATLDALSQESASAIGKSLVVVSRAVMKATNAIGFNILQNNGKQAYQSIAHVHFHIIPKYSDMDGLSINWNPMKIEDAEIMSTTIGSLIETL